MKPTKQRRKTIIAIVRSHLYLSHGGQFNFSRAWGTTFQFAGNMTDNLPAAGSHTLAGLVAKRAEIAGRIEALQVEMREMIIALENLDATIRLFEPNYAIENIRPKPVPAAYKAFPGDMIRTVLSLLRESPGPVSTKAITLHVMAARSINTADKQAFELFRGRVGAMLRHHRKKGLIRSFVGDDGQFMLWEIAPD
jgi:hypothetical protein